VGLKLEAHERRGGTGVVRVIKRAQILLAADAGSTDEAIAQNVGVGTATVYRIKQRFNGQVNLMQGVSLVNADDRSWDNVHRVAYEFAKSAKSTVPHQAIALVNPRENDKDLDRQLRVLGEHGKVVDVSNEVIAADYLRELLHLAPGSSTT
jgi:Homeodomain-like domain-containing protein